MININIVVSKTFILSFHKVPLQSPEIVLDMINNTGFQTPDWLIYYFFNITTEFLLQDFTRFKLEVEALDELINILNAREQTDLLRRLSEARKRSTYLKSNLWTKRELIIALIRREKIFLKKFTSLYLRDVLDSISYVIVKLDDSTETIYYLNDTYLAKVQIEAARVSNYTNVVLEKFSAIGTLILPIAVISGLFGMNIIQPGEMNTPDASVDPTTFLIIWVSLIVIFIIGMFIFRKIGWV